MILDNLRFLLEKNKKVVIRFPVIPGINDHEGNVQLLINWLLPYNQVIQQVDLLPFHATGKGKSGRAKCLGQIYYAGGTEDSDSCIFD